MTAHGSKDLYGRVQIAPAIRIQSRGTKAGNNKWLHLKPMTRKDENP